MPVRPDWAAPARDTSPRRPRRRADRRRPAVLGIDLHRVRAESGDGDAQLAVPLGGRDREDRVVVRMRARRRGVPGLPLRVVVGDLEDERPAPFARKVLDRLRSLAAGADRADARAERDQRRLEVSPGRIRRGGGAHVAADGRLPADLGVGAVARRGRKRLVSVLARSGAAAPIVTLPSARATPSSPARESSSAFVGRSRPEVRSGMTIVPPPITVTPPPSPKAAIALVGGGGGEDLDVGERHRFRSY